MISKLTTIILVKIVFLDIDAQNRLKEMVDETFELAAKLQQD